MKPEDILMMQNKQVVMLLCEMVTSQAIESGDEARMKSAKHTLLNVSKIERRLTMQRIEKTVVLRAFFEAVLVTIFIAIGLVLLSGF